MTEGRSAHPLRMVDVGEKAVTVREAVASGKIKLSAEALEATLERKLAKGDAITAAELAGIQAAKHVWEIVPLCHPLGLESAEVRIEPIDGALKITAYVRAETKTGVEMEALAAVSAAALTIYDMTKSIDRAAVITDICLQRKSGGKSGDYVRA